MRWLDIPKFTDANLLDGVIFGSENFFAGTSDGALFQGTLFGEKKIVGKNSSAITTIYPLSSELIYCGGERGTFLIHRQGHSTIECIDSNLKITDIATNNSEIYIGGQYNSATGAILKRVNGTGRWIDITPCPGPKGIHSLLKFGNDKFLLAGERGFIASLAMGKMNVINSGTNHPMRAICVYSHDCWIIGGGGWAEEMPILLEINNRQIRPIEIAGGNKVIVDIIQDSLMRIWVAHNETDGRVWHGVIRELCNGRLRKEKEFPNHSIFRLMTGPNSLLVLGSQGLLSFATEE